MDKPVTIGMAGAGRATELHMNALRRFSGIPLRFKRIIAKRWEQVSKSKRVIRFRGSIFGF